MKLPIFSLGLFASILLITSGCAAKSTREGVLPPSNKAFPKAELTLIWSGRGEAYAFVDGKWQRAPANDYDFTVTQRRYDGRWVSIKDLHRRSPDYDGKAGPRDQTMYFEIDYSQGDAGQVQIRLSSSLGQGGGTTDAEFRKARLEFKAAGVSSFAPYNSFRISQNYGYEEARLTETVELFKRSDDSSAESPFAKIEESATLFAEQRFLQPPTKFSGRPPVDLKVNVKGFKGNAPIMIAVVDSEDSFPEVTHVEHAGAVAPESGQNSALISNIPTGRWAVLAYQDQNQNGKLDKNFFGVPTEPWGVSGGARPRFRAPTFDESAIALSANTETEIELK